MKDKTAMLRIVNPLLGVLLLNQPLSILLGFLTGWEVFEVFHIVGGIALFMGAVVHVMLNWGWVRINFLRKPKKQNA